VGGPGGRFYSLYSEACPTAAGFVLSQPRAWGAGARSVRWSGGYGRPPGRCSAPQLRSHGQHTREPVLTPLFRGQPSQPRGLHGGLLVAWGFRTRGGARKPLEAILRRFSAFLGSWDQQRASGPLAGSVQRSPFAVVARHWLICGPTFLLRVGGRSGLKGKGRCRSPSKKAPPTTMKSDDLWVGLQVEEPGTV
jgi:hypothetical protein